MIISLSDVFAFLMKVTKRRAGNLAMESSASFINPPLASSKKGTLFAKNETKEARIK